MFVFNHESKNELPGDDPATYSYIISNLKNLIPLKLLNINFHFFNRLLDIKHTTDFV